MTGYHIALLLHLAALLSATAASAIVHLAAGRRAAAPTLRQAMEWAKLQATTARVFPVAVITLVATGAYMVSSRWGWHTGWIEAGLAGAVLLLANGAMMGKRGAAEAKRNVERLQRAAGRELPNDGPPDRAGAILGEASTGLALAIVVVMTLKPGLAGSLATLAVGAALGAWIGVRKLRAKAPAAGAATAKAA